MGCKVWGSIKTLPLGTLAISVTAQTIPHVVAGGCCETDGSGVWSPLPYPVGEGVTESDRNDCVLYLLKLYLSLNIKKYVFIIILF